MCFWKCCMLFCVLPLLLPQGMNGVLGTLEFKSTGHQLVTTTNTTTQVTTTNQIGEKTS